MSPESLVALEQLSPRVPAQLGVVPRHSPQEAGRGGAGRGTQVEGADPGIVSLGLPSLGIVSLALPADVPQLSAPGGECTHSKTVAVGCAGSRLPDTHTHTARVACVPAAAAWTLTSAELHCTTARKEMEPHRAGGGKKAD